MTHILTELCPHLQVVVDLFKDSASEEMNVSSELVTVLGGDL